MTATAPQRLLVAASGTGGHLFPALAAAQELTDRWTIEWLGVPDRLETKLVPDCFPLHTIPVTGFQERLGWKTLATAYGLVKSVFAVRRLLQRGQFAGVLTTGGYIAGPAIVAARSLGLPVVLHESNAIPGRVTRWFGPWCDTVAVGFEVAGQRLRQRKIAALCTGTPARDRFWKPEPLALPVPEDAPLIVVAGGSQGAVALNRLVREVAAAWFAAGAWVVHLTGDRDPDAASLEHPQYIALPFYDDMASLLGRADLAVSRSGAGTLTELAATATPSILVPYPFAADDHQTFNAQVFVEAGAAQVFPQGQLSPDRLRDLVLELLADRSRLDTMAQRARALAVPDSAAQLAQLMTAAIDRAARRP